MTDIPTSTTGDAADQDQSVNEMATEATTVETEDSGSTDSGTTDSGTADSGTGQDQSDATEKDRPSKRRRRMSNPVVWREMYTRFDSLGTAAVIVVFLALLGLPAIAVYATTLDDEYAMLDLGRHGISLFEVTLLMTLGLVMLIAPLQASGAIAVERDRQTLMPMQISLLRPWQIALGKIRVAATFSMYLLVVAAPILAIAWSVGSVPVSHLLMGLLLLLVTVLLCTTVTVYFSSWTKRSIGAAFMAFIALGAIIVGPTIGFGLVHSMDARRGDDEVRAPKVLLATNPVMALATAVGGPAPVQSQEEFMMFNDFGGSSSFERNGFTGPLTRLKNDLARWQGVATGSGFDDGFGPDATFVMMEGDVMMEEGLGGDFVGEIMLDEDGFPVLDEDGNPIPADADVDEDGNVVSMSDDAPIVIPTSEDVIGGVPTATTAVPGDETAVDVEVVPATTVAGIFDGAPGEGQEASDKIPGVPLWLEYIVFVVLISVLAAWGTTRRLRTPAATER